MPCALDLLDGPIPSRVNRTVQGEEQIRYDSLGRVRHVDRVDQYPAHGALLAVSAGKFVTTGVVFASERKPHPQTPTLGALAVFFCQEHGALSPKKNSQTHAELQ